MVRPRAVGHTPLFFEVNAGVLLTSFAAFGVHGATAYWDQTYTEQRRPVTPIEQHIHSLLEVIPLMATVCLTALHWDQGACPVRPRPGSGTVRAKAQRRGALSPSTRAQLLTGLAIFGVLPYAEELWRCLRARPTLAALPEPPEPATHTLRLKSPEGRRKH